MIDLIRKLFKTKTQANLNSTQLQSENAEQSMHDASDADEAEGGVVEEQSVEAASAEAVFLKNEIEADNQGRHITQVIKDEHPEILHSKKSVSFQNGTAQKSSAAVSSGSTDAVPKTVETLKTAEKKEAIKQNVEHIPTKGETFNAIEQSQASASVRNWATPSSTAQIHRTWADRDGNAAPASKGWTKHLREGLSKSRNHMAKSLASVFGGGKIDDDLYEELETILLTSDMGIEATQELMDDVRRRVSLKGLHDGIQLRQALKEAVYDLIKPLEQPLRLPEKQHQPFVIMMAGINGAGKTTSIGKLAKHFQAQGKSVLLAAGDTFRAAAREQLIEWGRRNDITVISQEKGDSASVCYDALEAAKARNIDVVLADTAGRLPTQLHLMEEIKKVKRVLQKSLPDAPHEVIVVLDANIGQNALTQVRAFHDALNVTGLIVTKLDGTAKGGILAALAANYNIPVRYIGVGEGIDDLRPFDAAAFTDALLDDGNVQ